jgi:hypothetical protein
MFARCSEVIGEDEMNSELEKHVSNTMRKMTPHLEALAELTVKTVRGECAWTYEDAEEYWETACGNHFQIIDGTPQDNEMKFCCYCGGELK